MAQCHDHWSDDHYNLWGFQTRPEIRHKPTNPTAEDTNTEQNGEKLLIYSDKSNGQIYEWHDAAQEHQLLYYSLLLVKYSFESMFKERETEERMIKIKQRRTRIGDAVDRMSNEIRERKIKR